MPTCFLSRVITVWSIPLDVGDGLRDHHLAWLSAEERERAQRFYSAELADRWRVSHVALRGIVAEATGREPAALRFDRDANGKPTLPDLRDLSFNLSHAGARALVAISDGTEIGVDVEELRPVPEMSGVAASHFAPEEQATLWAAAESERLVTFYRIWTRKEAYVKATGVGIGPALARFAVTAGEDDAALLYAADTPDLSQWWIAALPLALPYVGALCVRGARRPVQLREWRLP